MTIAPLAIAGMTLLSGAVSAFGAIQSANAQASAAEYNAKVAERNRKEALRQTDSEVDRERRANRRQLASIRAQYGASGLDASFGAPLDVLEDSATEQERDVAAIERAGQLRAIGYTDEANLQRAEAKNARRAGTISAVGTLFSSATSAFTSYSKAAA